MTLSIAQLPTAYPSIVHALVAGAERDNGVPRTIVLPGSGEELVFGHDRLAAAACQAAARLADQGVRSGDRVLICLPTSPAFLSVFLSALMLGAVPTNIATPSAYGAMEVFGQKVAQLVDYLDPVAIIAEQGVIDGIAPLMLTCRLIDGEQLHAESIAAGVADTELRLPAAADPAFIQCTSGSTGRPKGVVISHANLAAHCAQITALTGCGPEDVWVSWLPLYHDMGLIGGFLTPMFTHGDAVLIPVTRFLQAPQEWLLAVHTYRGTIAAAPNFAFGYAAARIRDEDITEIDLSSWRMLSCGAEPIVPQTVEAFVDRFQRYGLPEGAIAPCYGLAEATLAVTMVPPSGEGVRFDTVDRGRLVRDGHAVDAGPDCAEAIHLVDCGPPVPGTEVRIVDAAGAVCASDRLGHIQFRGPSVTSGYFRSPDATAACLDTEGWWDSGDLGYLREGRLRVAGRAKDIVIIRGVNHFPSDFEAAAEVIPGVRRGGVVATSAPHPDESTEALHLIVESELPETDHDRLRHDVRIAVSIRTGVPPVAVHVVPPHSIPKTTSGKLQRARARTMFVTGREDVGTPQ
ncbi:AMP-binding protein [Mycobacterium sp. Dal123C01]|uniref:AMP-binding protein n=1 Tax=Mycobacterium sp. Dal123C01 TaxID=3457577 RepID=UPI00403ED8B1